MCVKHNFCVNYSVTIIVKYFKSHYQIMPMYTIPAQKAGTVPPLGTDTHETYHVKLHWQGKICQIIPLFEVTDP